MKLLFLITSKTDKMDELMEALASNKISGATLIESTGMARVITKKNGDSPFLSSLMALLDSSSAGSCTVLMVVKEGQVETVKNVVSDVIGDLTKPDTGVLFTVPIDYVEGFKQSKS